MGFMKTCWRPVLTCSAATLIACSCSKPPPPKVEPKVAAPPKVEQPDYAKPYQAPPKPPLPAEASAAAQQQAREVFKAVHEKMLARKVDEALTEVEKGLGHDPRSADCLRVKGMILASKRDYPGAAEVLTTYHELYPKDRDIWNLLRCCRRAHESDTPGRRSAIGYCLEKLQYVYLADGFEKNVDDERPLEEWEKQAMEAAGDDGATDDP